MNMDEILEGWNEISTYLKVSDKTAVRYWKKKGLPVKKNRAGHPVITKTVAEKWKLNERAA
jgi:hypothetical protein